MLLSNNYEAFLPNRFMKYDLILSNYHPYSQVSIIHFLMNFSTLQALIRLLLIYIFFSFDAIFFFHDDVVKFLMITIIIEKF